MAMRVTGMYSGLDTETIIQELVAVRQTKVDGLVKEQKKLEWKQDAWKELNGKIYKLFNGTLGNLRYESSFMKKATSVSNESLVDVITDGTAMDSVQSLKIKKLARAGYLTGAKVSGTDGKDISSGSKLTDKLGITAGSKIEVSANGKTTEITITDSMTMKDFVSKLQSAGVKANFDAENQRLFIGAEGMGEKSDFTITASNGNGTDALSKLGILVYDDKSKAAYQAYADMASGTAEGDAARAQAVADRVAALLKTYTAEKEKLQKEVDSLEEKQEKLVSDFSEKYADSGCDIEDEASRASRKTDLEATIASLTQQLEADGLTDEEKTELTSQLNKAKGELSYIDGYNKNQASIDEKSARISVLESDYVDADGAAGAELEAEAEAYIQAKIEEAVDVIDNFEALKGSTGAVKVTGQDAEIELNDAIFTSDSNTFNINGLTLTCKGETAGEVITLKTENDSSGIYDMIKGFIKEYSELINEMDKLYNAESAKGYEPLTDEEKDAMSETEVEKWEEKIKDALLRRDSTLSSVSGAMKEIMASGFKVNGKTMYLSDFGIETLGYFSSGDNEKHAYHINGDEDDELVKSETNKLRAMINSDPDTVVDFFTALSKSLYGKMNDLMKRTEYSSIYTVYDDKKMKEEYDDYTEKIAKAEDALTAYEDKWYKKFSAMETALAKMQSNASAITSLLGG